MSMFDEVMKKIAELTGKEVGDVEVSYVTVDGHKYPCFKVGNDYFIWTGETLLGPIAHIDDETLRNLLRRNSRPLSKLNK